MGDTLIDQRTDLKEFSGELPFDGEDISCCERQTSEDSGISVEPVEPVEPTFDKIMKPLSSKRLRPIRQQTQNTVISILEDHSVNLELLNKRENEVYVIEVMRISSDGEQVTVFTPEMKEGVKLKSTPVSLQSWTSISFGFSTLPQKLWQNYQYAEKFVRLVKMRTPKITFYTRKAKNMLMESRPSYFEAAFYDGSKVSISDTRCYVVNPNGRCTEAENQSNLSVTQRELLSHSNKYLQHCKLLENTIGGLDEELGKGSYFPLVVGRRRGQTNQNVKRKEGNAIRPFQSQMKDANRSFPPKSLSVSNPQPKAPCRCSQRTQRSHRSSSVPSCKKSANPSARVSLTNILDKISLHDTQQSNTAEKVVFLQNIGRVSQLKSGEIQIEFTDETTLKFHPPLLTVNYTEENGKVTKYTVSDVLPTPVKDKLALFPSVIAQLAKL